MKLHTTKKIATAITLLFASLFTQLTHATTCVNAIAMSSSLPATGSIVCGSANDITAFNSPASGDPDDDDYKGGDEALYTFTPATTGSYIISLTANSSSWTSIWVFNGCPTTPGSSFVGVQATSSGNKVLTVTLTAGTTYYVMFDTYPNPNSVCEDGPASYFVDLAPPPAPNDECAAAILVTPNNDVSCSNTTPGVIGGSTPSLDGMSCYTPGDFNDVWFKFTATATSHDVMITGIPQASLAAVVYSGTCASQTELYCGPVNAAVSGLTIGTEYKVRIISDLALGSFNICINTTPAPPASCASNIAPANNAVLPLNPGSDFSWGTVPGATGYKFYIGETVATATELLSTTTTTANVIGFTPTTTYFWYVVPFNTGGDAIGCEVNATSFTTAASVPNDECTTAIPITANSGAISGSTNGATQSMAPGTCETYTSSTAVDVWYSVTADYTGNINVTTDENVYGDDLVWEAYSGTCGSLSAALGCSDTEPGFSFAATAGQTYYIRVYGYGSPAAIFAMQLSGTALPVTMDKLKGQVTGGNLAQLNWRTLSEENNKGFEVQRSVDGITFRTVGLVSSKAVNGNSKEAISYSFTDKEAVNGTVYYRLQQTDIDGKTALSNTVRLSTKENGAFEIVAVPNPVKNNLVVKTYGVRGDNAQVLVTDLSGKVVRRIHVTADEANIDMSAVANGIYLLKYTDATRTQTIKVSKQ